MAEDRPPAGSAPGDPPAPGIPLAGRLDGASPSRFVVAVGGSRFVVARADVVAVEPPLARIGGPVRLLLAPHASLVQQVVSPAFWLRRVVAAGGPVCDCNCSSNCACACNCACNCACDCACACSGGVHMMLPVTLGRFRRPLT